LIVTVTLNPAMDKTVDVDSLVVGGLNRIKHVEMDAGGKGINVSKTIQALGGKTLACGFLAGNTGKAIENFLQMEGIDTDFLYVPGETRTNTKVVDSKGTLTEINEPGPVISEDKTQELIKKLEELADEETLFILAGSVPKGVPRNIYYELTLRLKAKGAKVFLDADGDLFHEAVLAKPDIIKPNLFELLQYFNITEEVDKEEALPLAKRLQDMGIDNVIISMGGDGAMFLLGENYMHGKGLSVNYHSTVGAGDAMVAAFAYSVEKKLDPAQCARYGLATSAGAVETIGTKPPSLKRVEELLEQVEITNITIK